MARLSVLLVTRLLQTERFPVFLLIGGLFQTIGLGQYVPERFPVLICF